MDLRKLGLLVSHSSKGEVSPLFESYNDFGISNRLWEGADLELELGGGNPELDFGGAIIVFFV